MTVLRRMLAVLACLLLVLGSMAGVVNREVLDGVALRRARRRRPDR